MSQRAHFAFPHPCILVNFMLFHLLIPAPLAHSTRIRRSKHAKGHVLPGVQMHMVHLNGPQNEPKGSFCISTPVHFGKLHVIPPPYFPGVQMRSAHLNGPQNEPKSSFCIIIIIFISTPASPFSQPPQALCLYPYWSSADNGAPPPQTYYYAL